MTVAGVNVRLIDEGEGETVLFVHGIGGWAETWGSVPAAIAADGYRTICCDLPGFGKSSPPGKVRYFDPARPYYAQFLLDLMDALGVRAAHLAGHSLGGAIAGVTAAYAPTRVRSVALLAPGGFGRELPLLFRLASLPGSTWFAQHVPRSVVDSVVRSTFWRPEKIPAWLYEQAEYYIRHGAGAEFARVMGQAATVRGARDDLRRSWEGRAHTIRARTLVLWGREDGVLPVGQSEALLRTLPRATLETVANAGHLLMLEAPEVIVRGLTAFLRDESEGPQ